MKPEKTPYAKYSGALLIGPTGSGKTPFGACCEKNGMGTRPCIHFDFGAELRKIAGCQTPPPGFLSDEHRFIRQVLEEGKLLENEHFPIAQKMILFFMQEKNLPHDGVILLNGMPRHLGQAGNMDRIVAIREVIHLACPPEVVYERIRTNTGGDRTGRDDDTPAAIQNKLAVFQKRTLPLLEYYKRHGATINCVMITADDTAEDIYNCYLRECLSV